MTTVIDADGMDAFHNMQIYYALKLEANTGLRHSRGSVMNLAKQKFGIAKSTKKGVLTELEKIGKRDGWLST